MANPVACAAGPYVDIKELPFETELVVDLDRVQHKYEAQEEEMDVDAPVVLTWRNVSSFAKSGEKQILHNLSGKITAGFYAIMGPSGSGKTSLLNTLACRLDNRTVVREAPISDRECLGAALYGRKVFFLMFTCCYLPSRWRFVGVGSQLWEMCMSSHSNTFFNLLINDLNISIMRLKTRSWRGMCG
jgi:hypothetical protein